MKTRKYIIIVGDGMADLPIAKLGNRTPLQVARKPNMDWLARNGRCGLFKTIADGMPTGSEIANLVVMGYDPANVFQGRGVLEAASIGVDIKPDEIAMRCNLICLFDDGRIKNHSAGHITTAEATEILATLQEKIGNEHFRFYPGVSYRHLFVGKDLDPRLDCAPPHDHPNELAEALLIKPVVPEAHETATILNNLIKESWKILKEHPINHKRIAAGKDPANSIWLWSPGRRPSMWTYSDRFGIKGTVISAVDLIRGIGIYAGLKPVYVQGATGLYNTNYEGKADACLKALDDGFDFCYVHVEAPDEAGHEGDLELKIKTIQDLDQRLIGRIIEGVQSRNYNPVIAILPDHPTPVETRTHGRDPVPVAIWDPLKSPDPVEFYDEISCKQGALGLLQGDEFIKTFFNVE
jgi:2,3-bisphosphoglycerate-independent phosphoglycerate mutase